MLSRMGVKDVTIVEDGEKALEACGLRRYDLIFMDMQMPRMDGVTSCRAIMASGDIPVKPQIIFATAHVSESFQEECYQAGGSGFLPKPFNVQDIQNCLDHIVSKRWTD